MIDIETAGILVGSRRWGGWSSESDYDKIILRKDFDEMCAYLDVVPPRDHQYDVDGSLGNSFHCYINKDDKTFNFLVYENPLFFSIAKEACNQLDIICRTPLGCKMSKSKHTRYSIVQAVFKESFSLLENLNAMDAIYEDTYEGNIYLATYPKELSAKDKKAADRTTSSSHGFAGVSGRTDPYTRTLDYVTPDRHTGLNEVSSRATRAAEYQNEFIRLEDYRVEE